MQELFGLFPKSKLELSKKQLEKQQARTVQNNAIPKRKCKAKSIIRPRNMIYDIRVPDWLIPQWVRVTNLGLVPTRNKQAPQSIYERDFMRQYNTIIYADVVM